MSFLLFEKIAVILRAEKEKNTMKPVIGFFSIVFIVGLFLGVGFGTNHAKPRAYNSPDCCTGAADGCNPCVGGTSTTMAPTTTAAPTTTTTAEPTTTAAP
jgi:hypothetical protein